MDKSGAKRPYDSAFGPLRTQRHSRAAATARSGCFVFEQFACPCTKLQQLARRQEMQRKKAKACRAEFPAGLLYKAQI
jgi:hypothetical protein